MAERLTETTIRQAIREARLQPRAKQLVLWDAKITGLCLRLLPGGSMTFWYQYRPGGGGRGPGWSASAPIPNSPSPPPAT